MFNAVDTLYVLCSWTDQIHLRRKVHALARPPKRNLINDLAQSHSHTCGIYCMHLYLMNMNTRERRNLICLFVCAHCTLSSTMCLCTCTFRTDISLRWGFYSQIMFGSFFRCPRRTVYYPSMVIIVSLGSRRELSGRGRDRRMEIKTNIQIDRCDGRFRLRNLCATVMRFAHIANDDDDKWISIEMRNLALIGRSNHWIM